MATSTSTLRSWWAPPCRGPWATVTLYGGGEVTVRPAIVEAVKALDAVLRVYGYKATPPDCGAYNCRTITGGSGYSLHAYGIALDINWQDNPYGKRLITDMPKAMVAAIKAIRTKGGKQVWRWGGDYSGNKDAMHWEIICSPADLAKGVNWATVPGKAQPGGSNPPTSPIKAGYEQGDKGDGVGFLQAMLNIITTSFPLGNHLALKADKQYGKGTAARVQEFQRFATKAGMPLVPDGKAGPATLAAIGRFVPVAMALQRKGKRPNLTVKSRGVHVGDAQALLGAICVKYGIGDRAWLNIGNPAAYGPLTQRNMQAFQRWANKAFKGNMTTTGQVDATTWKGLVAFASLVGK